MSVLKISGKMRSLYHIRYWQSSVGSSHWWLIVKRTEGIASPSSSWGLAGFSSMNRRQRESFSAFSDFYAISLFFFNSVFGGNEFILIGSTMNYPPQIVFFWDISFRYVRKTSHQRNQTQSSLGYLTSFSKRSGLFRVRDLVLSDTK